ncbi:ABC transporter substrate-binding protein [Nesterenkonia pannonica]|uniref:ABC transporter substrate-binding protein n=1 Tax=Nesterenkonia pannonica TaxID=1548602 RepID=UPI0021641C5F|nr:ABC transporter substrate-binding protein [Nesterenkonia pannonica]
MREALALALDPEAIFEAVAQGQGEMTSQTFALDSTGFVEALDEEYDYDPERAEELLEEAGAADLSVELPISTTFDPAIYDSVQQNWEDVGITVERHQWGPGEAIPAMQGGDHELAYMQLAARDSWRHINFLLTPDAPWNPMETQSDELDDLVSTAKEGDETEQAEAAQAINQYVVDEYWFIPVLRPMNLFYWNDNVEVENQFMNDVPYLYNYSPSDES